MIDIQFADDIHEPDIPADNEMETWVNATLEDIQQNGDICIRIVDTEESQTLNSHYRGKNSATNVLSFPADIHLPDEAEVKILGDIVICAAIVTQQAQAQQKTTIAHWAHMVIHGTLHLCGFDHIETQEADIMEGIEARLLAKFGFADPYVLMS